VPEAAYEGISTAARWREYPHPQAHCAAWNVLWYDPTAAPAPPDDLAPSRLFPNLRLAVLRSSWEGDATVLSLGCAPLAGHGTARRIGSGEAIPPGSLYHRHAGYNAVALFTQGRYWIVPPGYARRDSRFQNTISVNGAQLLPDPTLQPEITAFVTNPEYTYVRGDAGAVFPAQAGVRRFRRHVLWLAPGWLVLLDEVELADTGTRGWNRFEWALHNTPQVSHVYPAGAGAVWSNGCGARLQMHVFAPAALAWDHSLFMAQDGQVALEALRLSAPEWYSSPMRVLAAWQCRLGDAQLARLSSEGRLGAHAGDKR